MPRRNGGPRRPSVTDVAKEAGVSVGTVSNVLNRPDSVSPATRARVEEAIEELRFVRNASARQLRSGEITTVGAVVLDIANPFFTEMARGIEDRLAQDDHTLMLCSSDEDPEREARFLRLFEERGVRGVIATPSHGSLNGLLALRERGTDVVLLDHTSPVPDIGSVAVDDVGGASLAMNHLLDLGHTTFVFLNGPLTLRQCVDRRDGVIATLTSRGFDPAEALVEVNLDALNADAADAAVHRWLAETTERPTAMFCANDFTALGALRALRDCGVSIPGDMAVVGYDDVIFASMLTTPLTSVRQPMHTLGWTAADMLLRESEPGRSRQVEFEPELVVRASSGSAI
ncbi:LacI family DNA-binding transcriptional regulator [Ruania alkalisoli]|uniref:LacI family DNA-binding transcriptional regulator n=1 Tax=Ruania alkalisoli TaxID=2779775 RepID=A0A7M1STN3_9MICO|nr:LacI family DNA-binding transcriptional regulator [Ruania alkalisoli]QOR70132.1 LacI family DNA-binding transcriptional regulator [Ruania alkalisoli]